MLNFCITSIQRFINVRKGPEKNHHAKKQLIINLQIDWLIYWLIDWLIDWSVGLIDWLIDWLSEWVSEWVSDWVIEWLHTRTGVFFVRLCHKSEATGGPTLIGNKY